MQTRTRNTFSREGLFQKKRSVQTRASWKNKPERDGNAAEAGGKNIEAARKTEIPKKSFD